MQSPASPLDSFLAEIGEALGHPIRIAILRLVAQGETCLVRYGRSFPSTSRACRGILRRCGELDSLWRAEKACACCTT